MERRSEKFKNAIYQQFARIGKAVASPRRIEILDLLSQGGRTVEVVARELSLSVANTSQHLQVLRAARLVEAEKDGVHVCYRLTDQAVADFVRELRLLAERLLAEVRQITQMFLEGREGFEPVGREELIRRVRVGEATVLDVRPIEEYHAGHIPGAISIPLAELKARLAELPREREIVAYCRGPYCVLGVQAIEILTASGFRAVRLEDGVQDWLARGYPIATGEGRF